MKRDLFIIRSIRLKKTILFPTDLKLEILTIHEKGPLRTLMIPQYTIAMKLM